eukprot:TRINITY_DN2194_c0_g1_i2.p1 TRINITY_DN2194_c0_g1~~TRINITY_DN2194_c0_g1_i2.p1  ORF type:complete len:533 (+),score=129.27 TRINITY_DN2194_c0_g1_i2:221-1819(+)
MARSSSTVVVVSLLLSLLVISVNGFGPSIHMREADRYIELCEELDNNIPYRNATFLHNNHWVFRLGAVWPDVARVLIEFAESSSQEEMHTVDLSVDEGSVDPHNRHFNSFMLANAMQTYPTDAWKVALSAGCLMHCSGDLVSQSMLVPHLSVRGGVGALNAIEGTDEAAPDGMLEDFIEGGLEIVFPDFSLYLGLADTFLVHKDGRKLLEDIISFYFEQYDEYFKLHILDDLKEKWDHIMQEIENIIHHLIHGEWIGASHPKETRQLLSILLQSHSEPKSRSTMEAKSNIRINWKEVDRLLHSPIVHHDWWNAYFSEGFHDLSAAIMMSFEDGQGYYDNIPNWSATVMRGGVLNALAQFVQGNATMEVEDGIFVLDMRWTDMQTHKSIRSISRSNPPSSVDLDVVLFSVPGRKTSTETHFTMRVRCDDGDESQVVQYVPFTFTVDPLDVAHYDPVTVSLQFDPSAALKSSSCNGFTMELAHGNDKISIRPPYFTSNWETYTENVGDRVFLSEPVYASYGTYSSPQLYSLKVQ